MNSLKKTSCDFQAASSTTERRQACLHYTGISLIEVLVAIAVVAVVMGLLVPAVQSAREAARRIQCASKLRQVVLALYQYESTYKVFPGGDPGPMMHSKILPSLEVLEGTRSATIYNCPSDPLVTGEWGKMRVNYYSNKGTGYFKTDGFLGDGVKGLAASEVTDGLSHTAAVAERLALPEFAGRDIDWNVVPELWIRRMRDTRAYHENIEDFVNECRDRALGPLTVVFYVPGYTHVMGPNENSCVNQSTTRTPFAVTATSLHPGGVNVGFGDGSLKFISDDIDLKVWRAIGTRNGAEVVSEF